MIYSVNQVLDCKTKTSLCRSNGQVAYHLLSCTDKSRSSLFFLLMRIATEASGLKGIIFYLVQGFYSRGSMVGNTMLHWVRMLFHKCKPELQKQIKAGVGHCW